MDAYQFKQGYDRLAILDRGKPNQDMIDLWYQKVKYLPFHAWMKAVDDWVESEARMPTIRQIQSRAYTFMSPEDRGEATEDYVPENEAAFGREMLPIFVRWLKKRIPKEEYLECMYQLSEKYDCQHKINWEEIDV